MASPRLVPGGAGLEGVVGIRSASWVVTRILQGDTAGRSPSHHHGCLTLEAPALASNGLSQSMLSVASD